MSSFSNQVALITGAGSGIGRQLAVTLAGESDEIVGSGLRPPTVKANPAEVPPPGRGLRTVMLAVAALTRSAAGTLAVS